MRHIFVALILSSASLFAQYGNLVTPGDGSSVVFSSNLSLKASAAHDWPKLFEATAGGVRLLEERFAASPPAPIPAVELFYQLRSQDQSSDGSVKALNTYRTCRGGGVCVFVEQLRAEIRAPGWTEPLMRYGFVRLSADGHYAFSYGSAQVTARPAILDLWTASVTPLPQNGSPTAPLGRRVIANNGTAVFLDRMGILTVASRDGVVTTPNISMPVSAAIIDSNGRFVIYEAATTPPQLVLYDLASGWEFPFLQAKEGCTQPALSDDNRQLLFLSAANWAASNEMRRTQAWVFDLTTGELRQLTRDPAGIAEATLSGDGRVVWAATLAGRLLRVEVDSRAVTEVVGRTAVIGSGPAANAPGSQYSISGQGLASGVSTATAPLPLVLDGIQIKINDVPLPLISVAPDEIRFVVPWELPSGDYPLEVTPGDSVFQEIQVVPGRVTAIAPRLYSLGDAPYAPHAYALHEDLQRTVTESDPAQPGEIVHLYASGLGPVTPSVPVDMPAPPAPPSATVMMLAWSVGDGKGQPAEVLFAGLAPGKIGVYQVDIRLPATLTASDLRISVSYGEVGTLEYTSDEVRLYVLANAPSTVANAQSGIDDIHGNLQGQLGHPHRDLAPNDQAYALHEDFRGPVTSSDPALPGEVAHLYASGLGSVTPAVPAGIPAPSEPLATTVRASPWLVFIGGGESKRADVLFSGLAPGQFGVYRVDIRLPATLTNPDVSISVSDLEAHANDSAVLAVLPNAP